VIGDKKEITKEERKGERGIKKTESCTKENERK
jgi:hypothetical protein